MAGHNRPALILAGIAGLCVSAATGVGLGAYTTTGINPLYSQARSASAAADGTATLDSGVVEATPVEQFSEATARRFARDNFTDRPDDPS